MKPPLNGVVQMSYAEYAKAPGIRQSRLKAMARSPAHFKAAMEAPEKQTRDFTLGRVFHTAVLEPKLFAKCYHLRPDTYQNEKGLVKPWSGNANVCKDWLSGHDDREILLSQELEAIIAMRKSVMEHPAARAALTEGDAEQCLFCADPQTGIGLKYRADWLSGNTIVDVKSTDDAGKIGFARSVAKFGYDVQAAVGLDMSKWLGLNKDFFCFVATEKEPPYAVAVYQLDEESIAVGRSKYRRWLDLLDYCMKQESWPAYDEAIVRLSLPMWNIREENNLLLMG
jgi:hypothetical protein